jgi:hypothetical protein
VVEGVPVAVVLVVVVVFVLVLVLVVAHQRRRRGRSRRMLLLLRVASGGRGRRVVEADSVTRPDGSVLGAEPHRQRRLLLQLEPAVMVLARLVLEHGGQVNLLRGRWREGG